MFIEEARGILECAMSHEYKVRVVYKGQVYEGPVRPSKYYPLSRFQLKESRAVEYQLAPWHEAFDPEKEGWMELILDTPMLEDVGFVQWYTPND